MQTTGRAIGATYAGPTGVNEPGRWGRHRLARGAAVGAYLRADPRVPNPMGREGPEGRR